MTYDNGLTKEQQKIVDKRFDDLMKKLKKKNPNAYHSIMKHIEEINVIGYKWEKEDQELLVSTWKSRTHDQLELLL